MTIDQTYAVDTSLALVDVETLMTKAFQLTHRLDGLSQYNGTPQGATKIAEVRAERDVIVREMKRRSAVAERSLVTVEVAERVMRLADEALVDGYAPNDATRIMRAREALDAGMSQTTDTTCSLVKAQALSDRIAVAARGIVGPIAKRVNAMVLR